MDYVSICSQVKGITADKFAFNQWPVRLKLKVTICHIHSADWIARLHQSVLHIPVFTSFHCASACGDTKSWLSMCGYESVYTQYANAGFMTDNNHFYSSAEINANYPSSSVIADQFNRLKIHFVKDLVLFFSQIHRKREIFNVDGCRE